MPKRSIKQKDAFQLSKSILDSVAPDAEPKPEKQKNPAAVALGRLGGLKGGKARAIILTGKERTAIARKAAKTRWAAKRRQPPST